MIWPLSLIMAQLFFMLIVKCSRLTNIQKCINLAQYLRLSLKYKAFLSFIRESFTIVLICSLINLPIVSFKSYGETIQSSMALFFLAVSLVSPVMIYRYLYRNHKYLNKRDFKRQFGQAYKDMRVREKDVLIFPAFYYLRRIWLVLAVLVFNGQTVYQVFIAAMSTIFSVIIVGSVKPFTDGATMRQEYLNEVLLMFSFYPVFCFTLWGPEP